MAFTPDELEYARWQKARQHKRVQVQTKEFPKLRYKCLDCKRKLNRQEALGIE